MKRSFSVKAIWDEVDQLWMSESDIRGLHIEAASLEEFYDLVNEFASELIVTNHYSDVEMVGKTMRDMIPAVVVSHTEKPDHAA
ncbi:MAG: DUF1902 domain-containing protein [Pseudomonadota bacterium]